METKDKFVLARTYLVAGSLLVLAVVIAFKLINIQIEGDAYRKKQKKLPSERLLLSPTKEIYILMMAVYWLPQ